MKTKTTGLTLFLLIVLSAIPNTSYAQVKVKAKNKETAHETVSQKIVLFNGKDLSIWVFKLKE
jgi:hypothetical protein